MGLGPSAPGSALGAGRAFPSLTAQPSAAAIAQAQSAGAHDKPLFVGDLVSLARLECRVCCRPTRWSLHPRKVRWWL